MRLVISVSLVGYALSYIAQGGLLNELLGDIDIEINVCPQIALNLGGSGAQDSSPVFQSTNPACPNYVPPSEFIDIWSDPDVPDNAPAVPAPESEAPSANPASYSAAMPGSAAKGPTSPNAFGARPGASYNMGNTPALPAFANNLPPIVADTVAAYNGGASAPVPAIPSVASAQPVVSYNVANVPALPIIAKDSPPAVADTAAAYNGGAPALAPAIPNVAGAQPAVGYNEANAPALPILVYHAPPPIADNFGSSGGSPALPVVVNNIPLLVADTSAVNNGDYSAAGPANALPSVRYSEATELPVPTQFAELPPIVPAAVPAVATTSKCVSRIPANNYQSSALLTSGPQAVPAVPTNIATARHSGVASELGPASAREPVNPALPAGQPAQGHANYVNSYGAARAPIAAMPTAWAGQEIPGTPIPATAAPVAREPEATGRVFSQHLETTVTVEAARDA
ncbi:hypothetical protein H4218_005637 [Coemansia sp. IMI 209128]|nr:hypothetical protein H4218_005637 [Coemansia sp. IMI 209128]